jgi:hypothetical protein
MGSWSTALRGKKELIMNAKVAEARVTARHQAQCASQYFYMGDLVTARFFFTVLAEVMQEIAELEREMDKDRAKRERMLAPRKPWFERS